MRTNLKTCSETIRPRNDGGSSMRQFPRGRILLVEDCLELRVRDCLRGGQALERIQLLPRVGI